MDTTLLKVLLALLPASMLFVGSFMLFSRNKNASSVLQLAGAASLLIVVTTHLFEALHLFPWMGWGRQDSIGHYLDLLSATIGLTLFPLGYLMRGLTHNLRGARNVEKT
jgi:hypothetical protein